MTPERWPAHLRLVTQGPALPAGTAAREPSRVIDFPGRSRRRQPGPALLSREGLWERVRTMGELAEGAPLSVVAVRVAGLARLHERKGWEACEEVVSTVAAEIKTLVRATDSVGRLNASTFGVALQGCGSTAASAVAARLTYRLNRIPEVIPAVRIDVSAATGTGIHSDVLIDAALEPFDDDAV